MFYNSHIHVFNDDDVPNRFLPLALVIILKTKIGFWILSGVLKHLIPFTDKDMFNRYVKFIEIGKLGTPEEIFKNCRKYYPDGTRFIGLTMDLAFMGAGKVPRAYELQLDKTASVAKKYPEFIPFMHVDPRREKVLDLLKHSVEHRRYRGLKIYPPLGYFPYDERLKSIYTYCQEKNLPVITHCSPYGPVMFKGKKKELLELLNKSKTPFDTKGKSEKELCSYFTNPLNYKYVAEEFPRLRICFAHFGSRYYWDKYIHDPAENENWLLLIIELISTYEQFYTDISFTLSNEKYFSLLKVLLTDEKIRCKVLFGSDYYMVETKSDERKFGLDLRAFLGEDLFHTIACENAERFLGISK